jgi:hypothetical protein
MSELFLSRSMPFPRERRSPARRVTSGGDTQSYPRNEERAGEWVINTTPTMATYGR